MKRFHVHLSVEDLPGNITFYNKLFGQTPSLEKPDYAKWMLDDPRINFAISTHGDQRGLDHFGFQAESETELDELKQRAVAVAGDAILDEGDTTCCYSHSNKHWTAAPSGIPWEHYLTMDSVKSYSQPKTDSAKTCCAPTTGASAVNNEQTHTESQTRCC